MDGWVKFHRKAYDNFLYQENRPNTRREAWEDIIALVNHEPGFILLGNKKIEVQRGQSVRSLESWGKIFKWDKWKVKRFFELLQREGMIVLENLIKTQRLTVCNYDNYQGDRNPNATLMQFECNANATLTHPNKKDKNDKKEKNNNNPIIPLNLFNNDFQPLIERFIQYRKDIKKPLKSSQSIELFIKNLEKYSGGDIIKATEIIDYSISNGYQGIFELKENPAATGFNKKNINQKNNNHGRPDPFGSSF